MENKIKIKRITIEFVDNGFVVDTYGYNPSGRDLGRKEVKSSSTEMIKEIMGAIAYNQQIDVELQLEEEEKRKAKL